MILTKKIRRKKPKKLRKSKLKRKRRALANLHPKKRKLSPLLLLLLWSRLLLRLTYLIYLADSLPLLPKLLPSNNPVVSAS